MHACLKSVHTLTHKAVVMFWLTGAMSALNRPEGSCASTACSAAKPWYGGVLGAAMMLASTTKSELDPVPSAGSCLLTSPGAAFKAGAAVHRALTSSVSTCQHIRDYWLLDVASSYSGNPAPADYQSGSYLSRSAQTAAGGR